MPLTNQGSLKNDATMTPRVFISYTRADGEAAAKNLRLRLELEEIPLWQDRVNMEGGRDWWLQISGALDRVDFLVALMTPEAMQSEIVRKEWRYARQQGVAVYPVKGATDLDFAALPRWMRDLHFYDLEHEWNKFVSDLRGRPQRRRVPFMADELPADFVKRPEVEILVDALVDKEHGDPVAALVAISGAGGFGKTTLAAALCYEQLIHEAFDDGIAWVRLGEDPGDLLGRVEDLIETFSGVRPGFSGLAAASARLAEVLADRDVLIVLDDVWNAAHLAPFIVGGPRCARLITTRNLDVLPSDSVIVSAGAMDQKEAVDLVGSGLPVESNSRFSELAVLLGCWPLLLRLVNGALRERVNQHRQPLAAAVEFVLTALDRRGLTAFDARIPEARTQAIEQTLAVSLELLIPAEQERYRELAIFPTGSIPLCAIERLWSKTGQLDQFDTEELCLRLARLSLLVAFDMARTSIELHDALRRYLLRQLGTATSNIHDALLHAYEQSAGKGWASGPDDGYYFQRLGYHLVGAGKTDLFYALLTISPDWMSAQFAATRGDTFYRSDVVQAISLIGEPRSATDKKMLFGLYTALQLVRQRAAIYTDEELQVLVYIGRKSEALSYAQLRSDLAERVLGLIAVATACSESESVDFKLLDESECLMRTIVDVRQRHRVFDAISAALVHGHRFVDARRIAEEIDDSALRAVAVARIGLSESDVVERQQILSDAFEVAKTDSNAPRRNETLVDLAGTTLAAGAFSLTRLVARELPCAERWRVLQRLVLRLASGEDNIEFQDVMSEALSTIAELPHAEDQAAAYTDFGCALLQLDCRSEAKRALAAGQLAANDIPTKDYFEQLEAIASVVAMIVPQEGFLMQAAWALNRIGLAFRTAGFTTEAEAAFAQARQALAGVGHYQRDTELSKIGQSPVSEPIPKPESVAPPKSESLFDLVRSGRLTEAATELERTVRAREESQTAHHAALHDLADSLANLNDVSTAFAVAEVISSAAERAHAQLSCVQAAARLGDRGSVERFFEAMIESVRCERPFSQAQLFGELFLVLAGSDLLAEANQILDLMVAADDKFAGVRLLDLVKELTATGQLDIVDKVVNWIKEPLWKEPAERMVSQRRAALLKPSVLISDLVSKERIDEASQLANGIVNDYERSEALAALAIALAVKGDVNGARMVEAEIPKSVSSPLLSDEIPIEISVALARRGEFDSAIDVARAITFDWDRARAFAKLGPILADAGHSDLAERLLLEGLTLVPTTERFLDTGRRIELLGKLIEAASSALLLEPTLRAATELEKHEDVPTPDKWNPAGQILNYERTQEAAQSVAHRKRALLEIGASLIASERLEDAERIAAALRDPALQTAMRRDGGLRLAKQGRFAQALSALGRQTLDEWIKALASWMPAIEEVEPGLSKTVLVNVLQIVGWLRSDWALIAPILRASNIN